MLHSAKEICDKEIKVLAVKVSETITAIEKAAETYQTDTMRKSTKALSSLYENIANAYLNYADTLTNKTERVTALLYAKDHLQFAIDELNKFPSLKPRLAYYLDLLHTLNELLTENNLWADIYAKQMLTLIEDIQQHNLLEGEHLHHIKVNNEQNLYEFAMEWLPIYLTSANAECRSGKLGTLKRPCIIDDTSADENPPKQPRVVAPTDFFYPMLFFPPPPMLTEEELNKFSMTLNTRFG